MKKYIIFCIFAFFFMANFVNASSCAADKMLTTQTDAIKVTASYEFKTSSDGSTYFDITVSNITENLYISYDYYGESRTVIYANTTDGSFTFSDFNTTSITNYTFGVWSALEDCTYQAYKVQLTKPKRNTYYDLTECKYEKMKDYYYCKEWIDNDFYVSDEQIRESISEQAYTKSTTSKITSASENDSTMTFTELYLKFRIYLIIGFAIGIVIDSYCLYLSFRKVKESTL